MRTWTERRGTPDLAEYGQRLRRDPEELDAFLDRVTINVSHLWRHEDQFEVLRTKILPELRRAPAAEDLERRLLLRRRGVHDRRDLPRGDPEHRRWRSSAPTSTSAWSPAPARATSPLRMPGPRRRRCCSGISSRCRTAAGPAKPELKRMVRFENGDLLRMAVPTARYDVVFCRNTVIYFTEAGARRAARAARQGALARRLPRRRHLRARVATRAASA